MGQDLHTFSLCIFIFPGLYYLATKNTDEITMRQLQGELQAHIKLYVYIKALTWNLPVCEASLELAHILEILNEMLAA